MTYLQFYKELIAIQDNQLNDDGLAEAMAKHAMWDVDFLCEQIASMRVKLNMLHLPLANKLFADIIETRRKMFAEARHLLSKKFDGLPSEVKCFVPLKEIPCDEKPAHMQKCYPTLKTCNHIKILGDGGGEKILQDMQTFINAREATKKRIREATKPFCETLKGVLNTLQIAFDERTKTVSAIAAAEKKTKNFSTKEEKKMGTMKVYKAGVGLVDVPTTEDELNELALRIQKEEKVTFEEAALEAERILIKKYGTRHYSDSGNSGRKDFAASASYPSNVDGDGSSDNGGDGLSPSDRELVMNSKRGTAVLCSDGVTRMKVFSSGKDTILPVDTEGIEEAKAFTENPEYMAGKRFPQARTVKKSGFSEDNKTFTDKTSGTTYPVRGYASSEEEGAFEAEMFLKREEFSIVCLGTPFSNDNMQTIASRAAGLLKLRWGNIAEAPPTDVSYAIRSARSAEKTAEVQRLLMGAQNFTFLDAVILAKVGMEDGVQVREISGWAKK